MVPKGLTRKPATPKGANLLIKVSELINSVTSEWDEQIIHEILWPEGANEILRIPIAEIWRIGPHGTLMQNVYFLSNLPIRLQWQEEIHWLVGMLLGIVRDDNVFEWAKYGNSKCLTKSKGLCGILLIIVYQ
jgi:hypothetical protein